MHQSSPCVLAQIGVLPFDEDWSGGFEQVLFRRKELVIGEEHGAAQTFGGKIN